MPFRLLPLLLLLLPTPSAAAAAHFDLSDPSQLRAAAAAHAPAGQIIIFSYVSGHSGMYADMGRELARSLDRLGHSYLVLAHSEAACAQFFDQSPVPLQGGCALDSVLRQYDWDGDSGGAFTIWILRYHACALFAAAGVGCTLLDADTVITRDFMPLLVEYEKQFALVHLGEGIVNGGMFHLRPSNASAAGLWVIRQVERRSRIFHQFQLHDPSRADAGLRMDQDEVSDALRVAATGGSAFDWWGDFSSSAHKEHRLWARFPQKEPEKGWPGWSSTKELHSSPWLHAGCPWPDSPGRCERLRAFEKKNALRDVPLQFLKICTPWDSEDFDAHAPDSCELALNAPLWLWSHGDPLRKGFDDQIAAYHLLGIELQWMDKGPGSHTSRYIQWLVRPGMSVARADPARSYLGLSDEVVARASNHSEAVHMKALLKHFFDAAVSVGKVPVMPRIPCSSPWIKRGDDSYLGIDDLRVADDGEWCYPGAADFDSCWPNVHFVYPQTLLQQGILWELVTETPRRLPTTVDSAQLQEYHKHCRSYFEELL